MANKITWRMSDLVSEIKKHKKTFTLFVILRALVIAVMVAQIFNKNYENVFLCLLTLVLFMVPSFIQRNFHIEIPDTLEIIILLFIFAAEILGEISEYYIHFKHWDTMLHTLNGFLAAAIGFSMVDILNKNEKFKFMLSPFFLSVVAFCFSMTIGVLWEFYEFGVDLFLGFDTQKDTVLTSINSVLLNPDGINVPYMIKNITSVAVNGQELGIGGYLDIGLYDTMMDLFVNFIGASVFSVIGYFYVKNRGEGRFLKGFIPRIKKRAGIKLCAQRFLWRMRVFICIFSP